MGPGDTARGVATGRPGDARAVVRASTLAGRTLGLASGGGYLWATASDAGEVLRIDPETHAVARVPVGGFPIGIVVAGGNVWVADHARGSVVRLDPHSLRRVGKPIRVGAKPTWLVAAAGSLFVTDKDDGTVVRLDVRSGKRVGRPIRIAASTSNTPAPFGVGGRTIRLGEQLRFEHARSHRPHSRAYRGKGDGAFHARERSASGRQTTNGSLAGRGRFTATGAISDQGTVVVYRKVKGSLITFTYVTSSSNGTITFAVRIDTNFGTSRWTIRSGTKAYKGLSGEGAERENHTFTVITLTGTVAR